MPILEILTVLTQIHTNKRMIIPEKRTENDSESRIQSRCLQWYTNTYCLAHHSPRCMIFHVANQNQHHLTGFGVLPGVSDLIVLHRISATLPCVLLWVEVKTPSGRQSPAQVEFERRVTALGYAYRVVRSLGEFQGLFVS